jgi:transposase
METVRKLPAVVKRMKDAARAVQSKTVQVVHAVKEATLSHLLDLPHFRVEGYALEADGEQDVLHLYCRLTVEVAVCPLCKSLSSAVKERKERCVRDLDVFDKRTFVHFHIRRFECGACGHRFTEELQAVGWRRHQTLRFEQAVYRQCLQSSKKAVAEQFHLSQCTVYGIFKRWAKRSQKRQRLDGCVRILGMDEIALKKRHKQYALVLSDLERRCVIAVLPSREQAEIKRWFGTLAQTQRQAIRIVSMDMWRPYRSFVERYLPQARIVADRFHVMRQLNDQLTKARRQIQRQADAQTKAALKGSRWLLVRNRASLNDEQEIQLQQALAAHAELRTAYLLKEEFWLIFERIHQRDRARRFLQAWMLKVQFTHNKYLAVFCQTLRNWFDQILNYFDKRITNGFVEGMNRAIRTVIACAYGFRNFDNFKLQILAQHGPPVEYTL